MASMDVLNRFVKQVVVTRRDSKLFQWCNWLREDMGSRPYAWLRPDYVFPAPFLVVKDSEQETSRILVEPHLIDAEFRKAWFPFFCRSGHPVVTVDQFLSLLFILFFHRRRKLISLLFLVRSCRRLLGLRSLLLVVWMAGPGMRLKLFLCLGSLGWQFCST